MIKIGHSYEEIKTILDKEDYAMNNSNISDETQDLDLLIKKNTYSY